MFKNVTQGVKIFLILFSLIFIANELFQIGIMQHLSLKSYRSTSFEVYQLFTYVFVNYSFFQFVASLVGIISVGVSLERFLGTYKFIILVTVVIVLSAIIGLIVDDLSINEIYLAYVDYISEPNFIKFEELLFKFPTQVYEHYYEFVRAFSKSQSNSAYIEASKVIIKNLYDLRSNISFGGVYPVIYAAIVVFATFFPHMRVNLFFVPIPLKIYWVACGYLLIDLYMLYESDGFGQLGYIVKLASGVCAYVIVKVYMVHRRN